MTKKEIQFIFEEALNRSPADQTEVVVVAGKTNLTRFSNSSIHQNVAEEDARLTIRVVISNKIGCASTNIVSEKSIKEVINKAVLFAKSSAPDPSFKSLPSQKPLPAKNSYAEATAKYSPEERAKDVSKILEKVKPKSLIAAGALSTSSANLGIANSLGITAKTQVTEALLNTVVMSNTSSGYASDISYDVTEIEPEKIAEIATEKALLGKNPVPLDAGSYPVILEPEAVADMISWLAVSGLGALAVQEQRSFMVGKFGKKITGDNITIWDNALDQKSLGAPFDFEGVPKKKVILIKNGVAKNVVYDTYTAGKEGKTSTGHALPAPSTHGPIPLNLFLQNGDTSVEEMIASTKKGTLVSRFHYTNIEDPVRTIFTGMTRDGTFLIEDGKIKSGVRNLRFTQNILEALACVEAISKDTHLKQMFGFGTCVIPALKVNKFNFTGVTEF